MKYNGSRHGGRDIRLFCLLNPNLNGIGPASARREIALFVSSRFRARAVFLPTYEFPIYGRAETRGRERAEPMRTCCFLEFVQTFNDAFGAAVA